MKTVKVKHDTYGEREVPASDERHLEHLARLGWKVPEKALPATTTKKES